VLIMLEMTGKVRDSPRRKGWILLHRILGYLFLLLFAAMVPDLKKILLGGEPIEKELWNTIQGMPVQTFNLYGPTECTVDSSAAIIDAYRYPTIGRPISNVCIHILDRNNQVQPAGVPGELCIAGAGLAKGYLNRPELTEEKFITIDLFGKAKRIYKTGDLARWKSDGTLEYLGRIDHQVKLRGFRIELGEIEAALMRHEAVNGAVVIPKERGGNRRLAAYISKTNGQKKKNGTSLAADLRDFLKKTLPDYMIPASFTALEKIPLTPNGKIDRKALPEPDLVQAGKIISPRSETETLLTGLYSAVLKTEINSVTAHFFELGGHSLLATQLVSRIRDSFEVDMPLRTIFEYPIVTDLADWIDGRQRGEAPPSIEPQPDMVPLIISHAQHRLWFLNNLRSSILTPVIHDHDIINIVRHSTDDFADKLFFIIGWNDNADFFCKKHGLNSRIKAG
ncbi:MAG: hypothetical protein D3924_13755, partial [Candidatus Electrothrix sp. AR4]|nr:hypothetical protein [Candidatus Electrothrix sp. AR4]